MTIQRPERHDALTLRWTGGAYEDREGMWLKAFPDGIWIDPRYDGGIGILGDESEGWQPIDFGGFVTWEQLDELREAVTKSVRTIAEQEA